MDQLGRLTNQLEKDFSLRPVTAAEVEFYLYGAKDASLDVFWQAIEGSDLPIAKHEKERGNDQYEVALRPAGPKKTVSDILALKSLISKTASAHRLQADFSAKPLADEPGNGLHIHLHLENADGKNVFYKDDDTISEPLKYCIGGLLDWLPDSMAIFAPRENSYARFTAKSNAPLTASWGANNRTVAIRLPDKPHDNKHIEHRVAGADADPHQVMAMILAATHDGLARKLNPGPQMYGDASLAQYDLPKLPATLQQAQSKMHSSEKLSRYFNAPLSQANG